MAVSREQLFRILKEHYILDMSQKEIAKLEKLSTATISRLMKEAKAQGYVKIELNLPDNSVPPQQFHDDYSQLQAIHYKNYQRIHRLL